jgi:hypothetical protein
MKSKSNFDNHKGHPIRIKNRLTPARREGESLKMCAEREMNTKGSDVEADVVLWFKHKQISG